MFPSYDLTSASLSIIWSPWCRYLSDARGVTRWERGLGELVSCSGRGVAGALLQLVPEFGHLGGQNRDA